MHPPSRRYGATGSVVEIQVCYRALIPGYFNLAQRTETVVFTSTLPRMALE
jgi:hypothetical protein